MRLAWATQQALNQLELHSETVSNKKENKTKRWHSYFDLKTYLDDNLTYTVDSFQSVCQVCKQNMALNVESMLQCEQLHNLGLCPSLTTGNLEDHWIWLHVLHDHESSLWSPSQVPGNFQCIRMPLGPYITPKFCTSLPILSPAIFPLNLILPVPTPTCPQSTHKICFTSPSQGES